MSASRFISQVLPGTTCKIFQATYHPHQSTHSLVNNHFLRWKHQWTETVNWWKFSGVLQCMSIFTMALSCQAQIFEVYNDLQDASIHAMNGVVRGAVNLCTGLYLTVGLFGYIALYHYKAPIEGNILTAYDSTSFLEMLRILFGVSVALSFPLVIFPCR